MKSPNVAFVSAILVSLLALSQSGMISQEPADEVAPYSIIDPIIKSVLEKLRPQLTNMTINDIDETISSPSFNGSILVNNILIQNLNEFQIKYLKSSVIPLRLTNLTLTWKNITATADYDFKGSVNVPFLKDFIDVFGKGEAEAILQNVFFTIGANVELKDGAVQIKPKGLFGFDLSISSADVFLSSLMGSSNFGNTVGVFLGDALPDFINFLKKPIFLTYQDDIIKILNQILKPSSVMDEYQASQETSFDSADLSSEIDPFFSQPLNLNFDMEDDEFNF